MSEEKTEEPSPRRQRQAREKGDIPVSAALTQTAALIAAIAVLPGAVSVAGSTGIRLIQSAIRSEISDPRELLGPLVLLSAPLIATAAAAALAIGLAQTGGAFIPAKLVPKLENLDPIEGFKRLFKLDRVYQVLRALVAASFVAWLSVDLALSEANSIASSLGQPVSGAALAGNLVRRLLWLGAAVSLALALLDVVITRRTWLKRNRMSMDEIKREHKESEGDPQLKQERKRTHQEMLNQASVLSIRDASVLVVNPTHLATALRYKEEDDEAPRVVAQGEGHLAKQLVDAARAYGVPVVRDIPVARALRELEVGDEIPEQLYEAVAEILRELWEQGGGEVGSEDAPTDQ